MRSVKGNFSRLYSASPLQFLSFSPSPFLAHSLVDNIAKIGLRFGKSGQLTPPQVSLFPSLTSFPPPSLSSPSFQLCKMSSNRPTRGPGPTNSSSRLPSSYQEALDMTPNSLPFTLDEALEKTNDCRKKVDTVICESLVRYSIDLSR